jgi:hypothetical protein
VDVTLTPHQKNYAKSGGAALDKWGGGTGVPSYKSVETTGWHPSCSCVLAGRHPKEAMLYGESAQPEPVPATILDPFAGSGTTGMVAQSLSRRAVLIDLNADYLTQVMDRNRDIPLGLDVA